MIQVEVARTKESKEYTKMYDRAEMARDESRSLDESLKGLTMELQTLNNEKEAAEARKTEAVKNKTMLEFDENAFKERIAGNIQSKDDSLKALEVINPLYESQVEIEKQATKRIMELETKLCILYKKQGSATQFSNKAARDKWLGKKTNDFKRVLDSYMVQVWKGQGSKKWKLEQNDGIFVQFESPCIQNVRFIPSSKEKGQTLCRDPQALDIGAHEILPRIFKEVSKSS